LGFPQYGAPTALADPSTSDNKNRQSTGGSARPPRTFAAIGPKQATWDGSTWQLERGMAMSD